MLQAYAQILLPTQADDTPCPPLPPRVWQPTYDGPHPLEPITHWCDLDYKPAPSEYPKIVRVPKVRDPDMLSVVKQQGEVLTAIHLDLARKLESDLVHQMSPALAAQYRPDHKSISVMVGTQKVRMRVKPTMDEDYLDDDAFVLRTIDRDGNVQWSNNRALTLFVHLFCLERTCEYDVCEIIRWQLYRQGFPAARVLLRPFVMTDVEIGQQTPPIAMATYNRGNSDRPERKSIASY